MPPIDLRYVSLALLILAAVCANASIVLAIAFGRRAKRLGYELPWDLEPRWVLLSGIVAAYDLATSGERFAQREPALAKLRRAVFVLSRIALAALVAGATLTVAVYWLAR